MTQDDSIGQPSLDLVGVRWSTTAHDILVPLTVQKHVNYVRMMFVVVCVCRCSSDVIQGLTGDSSHDIVIALIKFGISLL